MTLPHSDTGPGLRLWRGILRIAVLVLLALLALQLWSWIETRVSDDRLEGAALALVVIAYALLIALPFMPGVEIGLTLLALRGAEVAPVVWAATFLGLALAYLAGRALPARWLISALLDLRLARAADLVARLSGQPDALRLRYLCARLPRPLRPALRDWRYVMLALLLSVPGNAVIGGGGGIAMAAGLMRVFRPAPTLAALGLGVMPLPLLVWLFGPELLPWTA